MSSPVWWSEDPAPLEDEHRITRGDHYGTVQPECPSCILADMLRKERDGELPSIDDHRAEPFAPAFGGLLCRQCGRPVRTATFPSGDRVAVHARVTAHV